MACRCVDDGGIECFRWLCRRVTGPNRAKLHREALALGVSGSSEGVNPASLISRDLSHDVGGGAKAVEAEPFALTGHDERSITDQAGAQQRRRSHVIVFGGDGETIALVCDRVLGITAVGVIA